MDIKDYEIPHEEKDSTPIQQDNIVEEMLKLEQQMKNPNVQTYKKTTYWNQVNNPVNNEKSENLLKETLDCLIRIETKLSNIEILLTNKE